MQSTRGARTGAIGGWVLFAVLAAGSLTAGPGGCFLQAETLPPRPGDSTGSGGDVCGDADCAPNEDVETCPEDCAICGDDVCSIGEAENGCWLDCVSCGDGVCSPREHALVCPEDCTACGDGICSSGEDLVSCPGDCTICGDGLCSPREDVFACPEDCAICGDGICSPGEGQVNCAPDCGLVDCTAEPDFTSCQICFAEQYPEGASLYNGLVLCVICGTCYTVCDGAGSGCSMAPPMTDPCDGAMLDPALCGDTMSGCVACGIGGSCADELQGCQNNADCIDFATAIGDCPQ